MATYELTKDEEGAILRMRMTPAEHAAAEQKLRDHEEGQLRTRLTADEYAAVVAQREKLAAMTPAELQAESCCQLQKMVMDSMAMTGVAEAVQAKIDAGEVRADSMVAIQTAVDVVRPIDVKPVDVGPIDIEPIKG